MATLDTRPKINLMVQRIQDARLRRDVKPKRGGAHTNPLTDAARVGNYRRQNGHGSLTRRQLRQIGRMGLGNALKGA